MHLVRTIGNLNQRLSCRFELCLANLAWVPGMNASWASGAQTPLLHGIVNIWFADVPSDTPMECTVGQSWPAVYF